MAVVNNLQDFVNKNIPTRKQIAAALNPLPEMYQQAKTQFDIRKIADTMNLSLDGMSDKSAPTTNIASGMGRGGIA